MLKDLWNSMKSITICYYWMPRRRRQREKGRKNIWKDNSLKLPNLVGDLNLLIQEVQQTPSRIKSKRALI